MKIISTFSYFLFLLFFSFSSLTLQSQAYWQQSANYDMEIDFDVKKHRFKGVQKITYKNNSPDTLYNLFYHLYFNAFQPGSEMDLRSRSIVDPDKRVSDRISKLDKDEYGYQKINSLKVNGKDVVFNIEGTILEVKLNTPILPGASSVFDMQFDAQVPIQIRRSGRDSREGIEYSMSQWYPKLSEYDHMGWHSNPYVAREFYGIWGNFEVKINIDSKYILGATGVLQNAKEIGYGYADVVIKERPKKHTWHFKAENVHDFVWAADKDYIHLTKKAHDGTVLHALYQEGEKSKESWPKLLDIMDEALKHMNKRYGKYPYPVYSFIHGGDGGMEYPMATLITGERSLNSLVGVSLHEWMHSWYQMILGTNEALYPWMDEGFTSFASDETWDYLLAEKVMKGKRDSLLWKETIDGYSNFAKSEIAEPISTHADHYNTNAAYSVGSYTKGALCLVQLEYIMGNKPFVSALKRYYNEWKFKHPHPNDFFRIMEKESGMELDWYKEYWINTTKVTDYKIDTVYKDEVILKRVGPMPMPIELVVTLKNGKTELYYIPLALMRGDKKYEGGHDEYVKLPDWPWAQTEYKIDLQTKRKDILKMEIDPSYRMVDVNRVDNYWFNK